MTLSDLSIRRPVFAWMLMASFIVFGAIGLSRLGVSEQPDVDFPVLTINLSWSGAAPAVMETELVDPIEEAVISTQGLRDISSNIRLGQASVTLEFDIDRNIDSALTEIQSKISSFRLPNGADQPTITKTNPEDEPILLLAVSGQRSLHDLTQYVETVLADKFRVLPGVGEVVFGGYSKRNMRVWVDNEKLKPLQLTILDVRMALEEEHVEMASGYLENKKSEINVRTIGEALTAEQLGNIQIKKRGRENIYNSWIRIKDVARVEDGLDDIRHLGIVQGGPGMALGIKKQRGANAVAVATAVKQKLEEIRSNLPKDIQIEVNFDSTKFIKEAIHETLFTLILSGLITGIVCYLFLGSWSSTFNVLLSIPTSVMGTFIIIYFMGFTLNFFTLLGLSLAIGIIVDDAIMVLENIVRHAEMGKNKVIASLDGAREITFAAMAATAAVMAIFLPVVFMQGIIGKYFYQFGVTISAAVFLSLIEAITITPMRCSQLLHTSRSSGQFTQMTNRIFEQWEVYYHNLLEWCLKRKWLVIYSSIAVFLLSLGIGFLLRREFIPPQDQGAFVIHVKTPIGSSIQLTTNKLVEAEKNLKKYSEISRFFAAIGGFTMSSGRPDADMADNEVNNGTIYVTLKPQSERKLGQFELMEILRRELTTIPDLKAVPQDIASHSFSTGQGFPIELNIRGADYSVLESMAQKIIIRLKETGLMTDFDTDLRQGMTELHIIPNREAAAQSGVSVQTIADTISNAVGGMVQGQFTNGDRRYDVRIRLEEKQRTTADDIKELEVRTSGNELIPISRFIQLKETKTYQTLTRRLRERSISIFANVVSGKSQAKALSVAEKISREELPVNYRLFFGGGASSFKEAFSSLTFALWLGIIIAYMVLASQFNSFVHPLTVLIALPFSVSGAFLGLLITNQSINLYSMIGLILLMGIVKKNSILLVEFATQRRVQQNLTPAQAMLEAGPIRLRPILMTSFATLAAAIPPAMALGPGAESRIPLAVTVLGGVALSTAFTLLVVPCAYDVLSKWEQPMKKLNLRSDAPESSLEMDPSITKAP